VFAPDHASKVVGSRPMYWVEIDAYDWVKRCMTLLDADDTRRIGYPGRPAGTVTRTWKIMSCIKMRTAYRKKMRKQN